MIALVPIGWAIEALVASGVLMIAVLLVRKPVRRAFGPTSPMLYGRCPRCGWCCRHFPNPGASSQSRRC